MGMKKMESEVEVTGSYSIDDGERMPEVVSDISNNIREEHGVVEIITFTIEFDKDQNEYSYTVEAEK